jgi:hypothetical protein
MAPSRRPDNRGRFRRRFAELGPFRFPGVLTHINQERSSRITVDGLEREVVMKQMSTKRALLAAAVLAFGVCGSVGWSHDRGLSLSAQSAEARVGRPLTPVSVAGVARRTTRRAVGAAAVTGAVVAPACVRVLVQGSYVCR